MQMNIQCPPFSSPRRIKAGTPTLSGSLRLTDTVVVTYLKCALMVDGEMRRSVVALHHYRHLPLHFFGLRPCFDTIDNVSRIQITKEGGSLAIKQQQLQEEHQQQPHAAVTLEAQNKQFVIKRNAGGSRKASRKQQVAQLRKDPMRRN